MKPRLHSHVVASFLVLLSCKAAQEQTTVPRFPYPDGGLVDVYRKAMPDSSPVDLSATRDTNAPIDAPTSDTSTLNVDDAHLGDTGSACPASCDDNNPCTIDSCDEKSGTCANKMMDENSVCVNPCLVGGKGVCTSGICSGSSASDGTACDDHNPCTVNDTCKAGLCYSGSEKSCPPSNNCHENGYCDRRTGACVEVPSGDGKTCDDGLVCTTGDRCTAGLCGGVALACSSGGTCSESTGVCKAGDRVVFPSATLATAWNNVKFGGPGALARGPQEDLYAVGVLIAPTDLGAGTLGKSGAGNDLLVAKINSETGLAAWAKSFGDDRDQSGSALAVNSKGQVAVSGIFGGTMVVGSSSIASPGGAAADPDAFVAAVDAASGAGLWAMKPMVNGKGLAVAADPLSGDFVVCGTAAGHAATGLAATASTADEGEIVVARLAASSGAVIWGRQMNAPGAQTCDRVAFDSSGHLFLSGTISSQRSGESDAGTSPDVDFGSGVRLALPSTPAGGSASVIWVANLEAAEGKTVAAMRFGDRGIHVNQSLGCDEQGNALVAGGFRTRMILGTADLASSTYQSAFVAKLDGKLAPQWVRAWSGAGTATATQVAAEPSGALVVVGNYTLSLTLDDVAIARGGATGTSGFIARLDAGNGKVLSARGYGGPGINQESLGVQIVSSGQAAGTIWYAGGFAGSLQLGPPAVALTRGASAPALIGFIGKLAP